MPINWKSEEAAHRLLVCIIASNEKVDHRRVAQLYGQGVTAAAVEFQMRGLKREAAEMRKGADNSTSTSPTKKRKADDDEGIGEESKRVTRKSAAKGKGKKDNEDAASKAEDEDVVAKEEESE